jgi:TusA-related sulfurtransferase
MSNERLDVRGQICPMTVMVALQKVNNMSPGDTLIIITDDQTATISIPAELKRRGHEIERKQINPNEWELTVKIK